MGVLSDLFEKDLLLDHEDPGPPECLGVVASVFVFEELNVPEVRAGLESSYEDSALNEERNLPLQDKVDKGGVLINLVDYLTRLENSLVHEGGQIGEETEVQISQAMDSLEDVPVNKVDNSVGVLLWKGFEDVLLLIEIISLGALFLLLQLDRHLLQEGLIHRLELVHLFEEVESLGDGEPLFVVFLYYGN